MNQSDELRGAIERLPTFWHGGNQCVTMFDVLKTLAARQAAESPGPESKGLCEVCHQDVWILPRQIGDYADSSWHSKDGKVWHELCSYQQQIKKLEAALAERSLAEVSADALLAAPEAGAKEASE